MPSRFLSRPTLALAAFVLGSFLTLAVVGGAYFAIRHAGRSTSTQAGPPMYSRPEFTRLVMGQPEDEVIRAVGRPDETSDDKDARYWHFKNRTRDPLTGEEDTDVQVVIKRGKVSDVNY